MASRERFPIGASITLEQLERDPHPVLARLRASEPVSWVPALDGWLVTRRDLVLAAMRDDARLTVDDERFSTGRVVGRSMLGAEGPEHDRHRAPFAAVFRRAAVEADLGIVVTEEATRLIDGFVADGAAELRGEFAGPLATAVIARTLGLQDAGVPEVLGWYRTFVAAVDSLTRGDELPVEAVAARAALGEAVARAGVARDELTAEEAAANAAVILFGAIETTEGMIANTMLHLLTDPEAFCAMQAEAGLLPGAVEESLRLEPAAATIDRYAVGGQELGGAAIGAGDLVCLSIAGANRDPAVYPEPDRFDERRDNARTHLAFAHGPHVCLGMHLARLEARTSLRMLLERLPGLRLAAPARARGLVFRKPPALEVAWQA